MRTQQTRTDSERREPDRADDVLAGVILGQIERRAGGRIRDLHVSSCGGRIVLRGRSRTHYAKQLAQQAVLDVAEGSPDLTNRIVVG